MIINFCLGGNGGSGEGVSIETFNKFVEDQNTIDESQNNAIDAIEDKIDEIQLFKFPNATIIGEPTIQNGQVSDFSTVSYLQFPFIVDLHNKAFEINFCFTTATNVQTQQNILDSKFGIALAISGGKGLMAISSNGTSWNIGSTSGTMNIESNTTYYAKLTWDGIQYKTALSTNGTDFTQDMVLVGTQAPHPTTIFIGGCDTVETGHSAHPFLGTINLNKATLSIMGNVVWQGMDDAGLATRLATDMSNIDEAGVAKIKEIVSESDVTLKQDTIVKIEAGMNLEFIADLTTVNENKARAIQINNGETYYYELISGSGHNIFTTNEDPDLILSESTKFTWNFTSFNTASGDTEDYIRVISQRNWDSNSVGKLYKYLGEQPSSETTLKDYINSKIDSKIGDIDTTLQNILGDE